MSYRQSKGIIVSAIVIAIFCTVIIISCSSTGEKEKAPTMQQLVPGEMMGWKAQSMTEEYDRETIFDYINGAGEVYLSYGFQKVTVTRFAKPDAPEISVEIFDMNTTEDAYGVFSHAREGEETDIGQGYEYRGSLLCFWKAQYFICVLAEKETPESRDAVFALSREIDAKIPVSGGKPEIVSFLPQENLESGGVRFFHIYPSLNYHYFLAEDNILNLGLDTRATLGRYQPGGAYLLCIRYPTPEQAGVAGGKFIESYIPEAKETGAMQIEEGKWVAISVEQEYIIISLDATSEDDARNLINQCKENIAGSIH
jgi:hypothetical protein